MALRSVLCYRSQLVRLSPTLLLRHRAERCLSSILKANQEVDSNGKKDEDGLFIETTTASDQPLGRIVKVKLEKSPRNDTSLDDDVQVGLLS